jgi:hypothetical protein
VWQQQAAVLTMEHLAKFKAIIFSEQVAAKTDLFP